MLRKLLLILIAGVFLVPAAALAGGLAIEYDQRELKTGFTSGTAPSPVSIGLDSGHSFGLKATYSADIRDERWNWNAGAGYNIGSWVRDDSDGDKFDQSFSGWHLRGGVDRQFNAGPAMFYCGPGFMYESSTGEFETSGPGRITQKTEGESYNAYGLDVRIGTMIPVTDKNWGFTASAHHFLGFGSTSADGAEISQTENSTGFNAGMYWDLGF